MSTGINESLDIKYLNPINFWSWENIGSTNNGLNAFLFFAVVVLSTSCIREGCLTIFLNFCNNLECYKFC